MNANVSRANAGASPPQRLDFVATGGLMATTVSTPAGARVIGASPCVFFGVDVASSHLDICCYGASAVKRIANTPSAISC